MLGDEAAALAVELVARELVDRKTISGRAVRHMVEWAERKTS